MTVPVTELESHVTAPPGEEPDDSGVQKVAGRSPTQLALARFRKDKLSMAAFCVVALYVATALVAPILVKTGVLDPLTLHQDLLDVNMGGIPKGSFGGISADHWLGVEPGTGRDVLSRLVYGITWSLFIALSATFVAMGIGTVLGIISGFSGGFTDSVIGRAIDLTLSFPSTMMLLALSGVAVAFMTGTLQVPAGDVANALYVILVLGFFGWPGIARIVRGQVLSIREREFVDAARLLGASRGRLYFKEILPNLWAPLLVYFTLMMPAFISAEAALSYLQVGVKPPTPTLGNILTDSINYSVADFVFFFTPAFLIMIIVVSFNLLGDGLRDALDPKTHR
ncbi:ABC transporter permease [Nocardioides guangzhouensis]|uniref:ABC transporter permease n=1 Tax=Nocardioides guangzhouensis TaxID=2497878 RepID=A0A4Q4ZFP8_9ACTN|nr:ABC transporter permease [Nocardioides guangzhouensis]RYP86104.1 ABC transporter permease [Nocardioides guangzhouensis]